MIALTGNLRTADRKAVKALICLIFPISHMTCPARTGHTQIECEPLPFPILEDNGFFVTEKFVKRRITTLPSFFKLLRILLRIASICRKEILHERLNLKEKLPKSGKKFF